MAKLIPIKDNLAVVRILNKAETDSGIILETTRSDGVDKVKVIAIGPEVDLVVVGDTLLIDWNTVRKTEIEGAPVYILSQKNISAVFEN